MRRRPGTPDGRQPSAYPHATIAPGDFARGLERLEPRFLLSAISAVPTTADPLEPTFSATTTALTAEVSAQPLSGDANADGSVNSLDISPFIDAVTGASPAGDVNGDGVVNALDMAAFTSALTTDPSQPALTAPLPMGMNLSPVNDWNREWPFADAYKTARGWFGTRPDGSWTGGTVLADANGWPLLQTGQAAGTLMFRDIDGHYPSGTYIATFEGDGDLAFSYDAKQTVRLGPNRYQVTVQAGNSGVFLNVTRSNPENRVRNIHFWMPGLEEQATFHPLFLERLRPFSVIRFMDWQQTNGNTQVQWADRAKVTDARQSTSKGVAYEYIIQLCNELNANPWISIPHLADDNYVRQMATLFRDQLKPGLKVYLEYSNEIWNAGFPQGKYVESLPGTWMQSAAERIASTFGAWTDVWGGQSNRLVRVVAGQKNNPWLTKELVKTLYTTYGPVFDAVSCSGYIGPSSEAKASYDTATTAQQILADTHEYTVNHNLPEQIAVHASLAAQYTQLLGRRIQFLVYEGGQHIDLGGDATKPYTDAYYQVQSDPGMYTVYQEMLRGFRDLGGELFCAYSFAGRQDSKYGSWGHLDYQDQPLDQAPKYAAAVNASLGLLDGNPTYMAYSVNAQPNPSADVNGDGLVNSLDILSFVRSMTLDPLAADANRDGDVNALDVAPFVTAVTGSNYLALASAQQSEVLAGLEVASPAAAPTATVSDATPISASSPLDLPPATPLSPRISRAFSAYQLLVGLPHDDNLLVVAPQ